MEDKNKEQFYEASCTCNHKFGKGLSNIQQELDVPKTHWNKFGEYYYRNCEDILDAVKPLLLKHNCNLYLSDSISSYGDKIYVVANVCFMDETGFKTEVKSYARETIEKKKMDSSQLTGAASSYARKYALSALFLIDDVKDSDTTNTGGNTSQEPGQIKSDIESATPIIERQLTAQEVEKSWNGKIYKGIVYINNQRIKPPQDQIEKLKLHKKFKEK